MLHQPSIAEAQYTPTTLPPAMSFSEAVDAMKAGKAVRRACGTRLYVFIAGQGQRFSDALGSTVFFSVDDVLATNWEIAGELSRVR